MDRERGGTSFDGLESIFDLENVPVGTGEGVRCLSGQDWRVERWRAVPEDCVRMVMSAPASSGERTRERRGLGLTTQRSIVGTHVELRKGAIVERFREMEDGFGGWTRRWWCGGGGDGGGGGALTCRTLG